MTQSNLSLIEKRANLPFDNFDVKDSSNYMTRMIGLRGLQVMMEKSLEDGEIDTTDEEILERSPQLIFEYIPVSAKVFMDDWLGEPCYPLQQRLVDRMIGDNPLIWDTKYEEACCAWGMGCLDEDTIIEDAITGEKKTVKEWMLLGIAPVVRTIDGDTAKASVPFKKGKADIYEVITESGKSVKVTLDHKFLTNKGWIKLRDLKVGDKIATEHKSNF